MNPLPVSRRLTDFSADALALAPRLLGKFLCRRLADGTVLRRRITETEAYFGEEDTAIAFASRYVHEQFHSYDEYVQASLEDFVNLQNGLFIVNVSNTSNTELTLGAPEHITVSPIQFSAAIAIF